ncbi:MAG: DEAD/DEAH box helicase [Subdoligranulum sp.]|nr:DEAD/DEAH box helicase [Subdoligranulum sp.]MDD7266340.1 DEAD/DEAH box helicase [Subdoligranulum sp.]MDY5922552.1 DEAD/DEAH box helicase [Oscillospiraceae bacterium]
MTFQDLPLQPAILKAVAEAGYTSPSPIQAGAIPPVLAGRDLLGCAQTGTGKTAAFALPILQNLSAQTPQRPCIRALILTPTRELALQIGDSFSAYGKHLKLRHTVIFGGVGQQPQVEALRRGVDILIACPGRLNDLIGQRLIDLSGIEIFVLDEADRMLDMGFIHDVKKVIAKLPRRRQTLLFSATMPKEIEELADSLLHDPAVVKVDPVSSTVDRIDQKLYFVEKKQKIELLAYLLQDKSIVNALVFSRTKHGADRIARLLNKAGITAAAIHGNKSQTARVNALEGFKAGKTRVLVATDIAARGIDISELSHVFNYDLPEVPETYVHRIGRTARAGADGVAISFCSTEEREYLAGIEKLNRKKIPVVTGHPWEGMPPAQPQAVQQPARKGAAKARSAAKAAPAPELESEEPMQNPDRQQSDEGRHLSASAKRRRRRRRAMDRSEAAAPAAQAAAKPEEKKHPQPEQRREKPEAKKPHQPRQAAARKPAQPALRAEEVRAEKQPRREKSQPPKAASVQHTRRAAAQNSEDPGLLLISRKPPVQKFASFEAYMEAHGGATAPIEESPED